MSEQAFHEFYRATLRPLVRHLRRLGLVHPQDLEDVVQEAYTQAFRAFGQIRAREAQVVWLLTIARRQWGRVLARRGKFRMASEDALDELVARQTSPDDQLARRTTLDVLKAQIAAIGDVRQRHAVELFYLYDWDLPEVSAATGVNPSTLTTWLSRFRQRARVALAPENEGSEDRTKEPLYARYRQSPG